MPTGGTFLYRTLQQRLSRVLRKRYRDLHGHNGDLIPNIPDLQAGMRTILQEQVIEYGEAGLMAFEGGDVPMIDISASENEYRIVMPVAGYALGFSEMQAMQASTSPSYGTLINPRDTKMAGARRAIEEKCNSVAFYGVSAMGFTGLLNNASADTTASSFDPFSATSTADDIADWFLEEVGDIAVDTNNVEYPNTAGVSTELYNLMARRRMPDSSVTILNYILETQRAANGIREIYSLQECRAVNLEAAGVEAPATNRDRIVLFPKDPEVLERHMMGGGEGMIRLFPEDWVAQINFKKVYPMYACISQTIINFPKAVRYLTHAKQA